MPHTRHLPGFPSTFLLLLVPLLAGCAAPAATLPPNPHSPPEAPRPEVVPPRFDHVVAVPFFGGSEPNIRVSPQDHAFVSTTGTHFWRSADGGSTWEAMGKDACPTPVPLSVCPPTFAAKDSGLVGGGDGALALDAQGRLHWAGLAGSNASVPYQWSDDEGTTWSEPLDLAAGNVTDREWITAGPGGSLYTVWRDDGTNAVSRPALMLRTSRDRGATWGPITPIFEQVSGGNPATPRLEPVLSPLVLDPGHQVLLVAIRSLEGGHLQALRSLDDGATWSLADIASREEDSPVTSATFGLQGFIFPWAAFDAAGNAYVVWAEDAAVPGTVPSTGGKNTFIPRVFISVSKDQGATWSTPEAVSPPDRAALFPTLVAGSAGRVAVAWYESSTRAPSETVPSLWYLTLAMSTTADRGAPGWLTARASDEPVHVGTICTQGTFCPAFGVAPVVGDRSRGDFFEMTLRPNGLPIIAFVKDTMPPGEKGQRRDIAVVRVSSGTPLWG